MIFHPGDKFAGVCAVSPYEDETLKISGEFPQQHFCSVPILNRGRCDKDTDYESHGIGNNVPLSALHLLTCVISPNARIFRSSDGLTVNASRTRIRFATGILTSLPDKFVMHFFPCSVFFPFGKAVINGLPRRKMVMFYIWRESFLSLILLPQIHIC